jgi:3'-phosphoadenosine 5'-phosphosulfate sulfotransferase (PAPS reductase)/FAD synthetase
MKLNLLASRSSAAVATTPEVDALLAANAPVAVGVSGGKDGAYAAIVLDEYLNLVGHRGPRLLIHSDLDAEGAVDGVEWRDSLPACHRLSDWLGWELVTVRRAAGGLMERWEQRWENNVARYAALSCVRLILPWSTASMRFCTSELKTDVICAALRKRFPGQTIVSVTGIRRDESATRKRAPVAKVQPKLCRGGTSGIDWHPAIEASTSEVYDLLHRIGFPMHEAYARYGSSRVSCRFCILASEADLRASARCPDNVAAGRRIIRLEVKSTFAFRSNKWLGDVAAGLLTPELREAVAEAKQRAKRREAAESRIPDRLLYTAGWPTCIPTYDEAALLADVRRGVADAVGLRVRFLDGPRIVDRYRELMAANAGKAGAA